MVGTFFDFTSRLAQDYSQELEPVQNLEGGMFFILHES